MTTPEGGAPFPGPDSQKPEPDASQNKNSVTDQWNTLLKDERVQQARQVSKQYSGFFLSALTHPYRTMKSVGTTHTLYGLITMALTVLLSAVYFLSGFIKWDISPAFGPGFLKPLLLTALGLAVALGLAYAVLRVEKVAADPKLLLARFGTLLVPTVALLVLAILFLLLSLHSFSIYLLILSYLVIFVALNVVVFQYPLNASNGPVDFLYLLIIANTAAGYIFYKLVTSVIAAAVGGFLSGVSPFGF